jgi:AraC-like DNA-binding protein
LAALAQVVEARGVSKAIVLAGAGVPLEVLNTPEAPLPLEAIFGGWAAAMRAVRDDGLPVHVARTFSIEHYSVLGFAVMTAASGREAIARVLRFGALVTAGGRWEMEERSDALHARWLRAGQRTLGHRAANEAVLAEFLHVSRQILGADLQALAVSFRHAAPSDTRLHREHFGVTPSWQADADELVLPKSLLAAVPSFANPALSRHFESLAQRLLNLQQEASSASGTTARVRSAILEALPDGEPASTTIAKQLGMSERTLRRALANERASFTGLVEAVRKERAALLISDRSASLAEVAFSLGFSELSAFSRAFKRWHGRAPSEVRRASLE